MRIALVGCGYVADFYLNTLPNHPELEIAAVTDRDAERTRRFASHYGVRAAESLEEILEDPSIELVVNLTNPASHYAVSRAALESGKHVYSEKPLAMEMAEATTLVERAEKLGLRIASAPCNVLGETAQTVWKALREEKIGRVRLVYAEQDNGFLHRLPYRTWRSESGTPWPWKDEFEVGCTLEHAGYYLTWLAAFFGPARSVTSFASILVPDKECDAPLAVESPDFSVACIEFDSGVVARLSCSIVAPRDHTLRVFGDEGVLSTPNCWDYASPVYLKQRTPLHLRAEKYPRAAKLMGLGPRAQTPVRKPRFRYQSKGAERMDFARGIAELAASVREGRPCRLSARFCLHVNELALAIQNPDNFGTPHTLRSTFDPIEPMSWAT